MENRIENITIELKSNDEQAKINEENDKKIEQTFKALDKLTKDSQASIEHLDKKTVNIHNQDQLKIEKSLQKIEEKIIDQ